ncbi:MAG: phosphatidate cytidylyltransferase [Gammaproteobacteria bacterium]|jgi:phosphatidate cytidylyltransferase|nr:phosphatidate cytidylyltransferase [Gammaproteobacteria bacterium]MDP6615798.1 phosphatidate cytidylyltransferase [Gammaproteobacteria bacterium]MDP6695514.1 phosphatidate cytidylyltransferase [Gammaproteobacteria bacterium]
MSSLTKRIITAAVLVIVLGAAVFLLPASAVRYVLGAFVLIGVWEWSGFFTPDNPFVRALYTFVMACVGLVPTMAGTTPGAGDPVVYAAVGWWLLVLCWLAFGSLAINKWSCALAGLFCLQPAWLALARLMDTGGGVPLLLCFVAMVAAADIGAYFTGRRFGQRKLAPRISPGKTWEGLAGGLLCAAVAALFGASMLKLSPLLFAAVGIAIAAVSVIGDLTVSAFKRYAGLKDSGTLLPGHGGVLDRIDGMVAALPVYVVALLLTGTLRV